MKNSEVMGTLCQYSKRLGWMAKVQFPAGTRVFLFSTASRSALGFIQLPIPWI
jgi:hypothetical protein